MFDKNELFLGKYVLEVRSGYILINKDLFWNRFPSGLGSILKDRLELLCYAAASFCSYFSTKWSISTSSEQIFLVLLVLSEGGGIVHPSWKYTANRQRNVPHMAFIQISAAIIEKYICHYITAKYVFEIKPLIKLRRLTAN